MSSTAKRVVIDVDTGTDDALALLVLLYGEKLGLLKLEAITCVKGNASVENTTKNTVRLLETLNRTDIKVYKGAADSIITAETPVQQYHGKDGFGDLDYDTEPNLDIVNTEPAAVALRDLVVSNPKEINLICLGPLTNIALAMKLYQDFSPNIKEIFIMGGNYAATGNITETAEFNFYVDPEAASIVLNDAQCPITVVTWETCLYTEISYEWRWEELGKCTGAFMNLLNRAEKSIQERVNYEYNIWYPCDALVIIALLYPNVSVIKKSKHNATVELHGSKTRGQIVLDHLKKKETNVTMLEKMDENFIKNTLLAAAKAFSS